MSFQSKKRLLLSLPLEMTLTHLPLSFNYIYVHNTFKVRTFFMLCASFRVHSNANVHDVEDKPN